MSKQRKRLAWRCKNLQQQRDKAEIYNSREWRELRTAKLSAQPLCEKCLADGKAAGVAGGWVRSAHVVHHIIPIESATTKDEMRRLAFAWGNLMSLCDKCHSNIHNDVGYHTKQAVKQREQERHERRKANLIERFTGQVTDPTEPPGA